MQNHRRKQSILLQKVDVASAVFPVQEVSPDLDVFPDANQSHLSSPSS